MELQAQLEKLRGQLKVEVQNTRDAEDRVGRERRAAEAQAREVEIEQAQRVSELAQKGEADAVRAAEVRRRGTDPTPRQRA